ncbi:PAS domain-containing sensor histidine kinase [Lysobacter sp.]|uniref:PAS domain-containing sensor histidine kinase n=1 Tax=Lysobacter sp. TaxID=72226 RepID=UPI002D6607C3|nr:ATP-binding protein [Lysobacter sp.]HZX76864.1 ATP-binding protein [Lysobacter sp.]
MPAPPRMDPYRSPSLSRGSVRAPGRECMNRMVLRAAAALLMLAIFLLDTLTTLEGAVAVLYVVAVLLVAGTHRRGDIIVAAVSGAVLTLAAYVDTHGLEHVGSQTVRAFVSLAAIGIAALLALRNQSAVRTLVAQATLLDVSHDMIFVRDIGGTITFWNSTAESVYGWSPDEALGRKADELLGTCYPDRREAIEAELLATGRWEGVLEQVTRHGNTLVLDSRWVLQRDHHGRIVGVLETHTDVTERKAAYAALVRSERRYRRMFDESRIGVLQQDWSAVRAELDARGLHDAEALAAHIAEHPGFISQACRLACIEDVNPAFATMLGGDESTPAPASVHDVLGDADRTFAGALLAFARGDAFHEGETEIVRVDGSRAPVLFTITFPLPEDGDATVLVFVLDNTERRRAQDALLLAQTELAHASRVSTLGELTASIAHEVNQPLMTVVTYGEAGLRWLRRDPPDLGEVETAITRIVSEGRRAGEIVQRIRAFLGKAPARSEALDVTVVIEDAARLVQHELARGMVELQLELEPHLPEVRGDRVQLQQVLVNLMVNASQAMTGQPGRRHLAVRACVGDDCIDIAVADTGPGILPEHMERLFDPFFTTRPQGMGMGLAICRTIAEAHGGRLVVDSEPGRGATFTLSLSIASTDMPA